MILATDMADHMSHINVLDSKIQHKNISKERNNGHLIIDETDDASKFQSQQLCLEQLIHACDLSTPTRSFETCKKWTYMLMEEFFTQGDVERTSNKPISFLCDRATVNVARAQPGFLNNIVLPYWNLISTIFPQLDEITQRAQYCVTEWQNFTETDEEKLVYSEDPNQSYYKVILSKPKPIQVSPLLFGDRGVPSINESIIGDEAAIERANST